VLDRPGAEPELARLTKRLKDKDGKPIGKSNGNNPILDSRLYEVEFSDVHKAALSANTIAENLFSQVDADGHRQILFEEIIGHRNNGSQVDGDDAFVESKNGTMRRKETTQGRETISNGKMGPLLGINSRIPRTLTQSRWLSTQWKMGYQNARHSSGGFPPC
jgi:hypothetical protein